MIEISVSLSDLKKCHKNMRDICRTKYNSLRMPVY